ncbi:MAG: hypothetical protein ACW98W_19485 [Candidatus Hodarchaeales archaeon]|jgi:hypothetical protein
MDLTIAISSFRDYEEFLKPTIDEIKSYPNPKNVQYEILVYGPKHLDVDDRIDRFYEEKYRQGNLYGYNYLTWMSSGRNIAYLTDDMTFGDNFFEVVDYLDNLDKKIKVAGYQCNDVMFNCFPNNLITHNVGFNKQSVGNLLGYVSATYGFQYANQRIPCARFLAANKASIDEYMSGYIFNPNLFQGGGDLYLSVWSWLHNEIISESIPIRIRNRKDTREFSEKSSVTEYRDKDAEVVSNLIDKLALGYHNYV